MRWLFVVGLVILPQLAEAGEELQLAQGNYYVISRYYCVDVDDSEDSGSCDVTTQANSCQEAYNEQRRDVQSRGDVCRFCTHIVDNTQRYSGQMDWIHGGSC